MAGHSHWAGIKHKKAANDAKRGKVWSKIARMIIVAAKAGGGDETGKLIDLLVSTEPSPVRHMEAVEEGGWVCQTLNGLPEHLRLVVNLVYYQGLKYREAAEVLSIPVGTVKSRLHAAIRKLEHSLTHACLPGYG